jgi:hypothetical protein
MSEIVERMRAFVEYCSLLKGDEKGEAQVFADRLFKAFGQAGYKEAGATLESRVKRRNTGTTSFADLLWPGKLLLEMKRRGTKLGSHLQQAFDYWIGAVPNRPRYVILCNFDELWIYDFDTQIDEPVDVVHVPDLPRRYTALNFLFPDNPPPIFGNDRVAVTRDAADKVAAVFRSLVARGEQREVAQRFILQSVVAMFAEDMDLLPSGTLHHLIEDCRRGHSSYDLFGSLFRQMNEPLPARAGRFKGVPYFNGGLFRVVEPCEMQSEELNLLAEAASTYWARVNPGIFGTLFQDSMDAEERHALGAHFTSEADILRVVLPTIVRPWRERIAQAQTLRELVDLRKALVQFRVLDPACGSGNFLYVSYREMVRLEIEILQKIENEYSAKAFKGHVQTVPNVSARQFFGVDTNGFGVELAKVTLMLAKKLAIDEAVDALRREQSELGLDADEAIPLDNLDANFLCADALFVEWPKADVIIGNPPYQSKNKMQEEYGPAYLRRLRERYPDVPGRADYCVYWFRRAHDELGQDKRAGLVGTNTIRQNESRVGGLDYIVANGGTITEAVATQVWPGDAVVHVSIVNWAKGKAAGKKKLFRQIGDKATDPWEVRELDVINSALSYSIDVSLAAILTVNTKSGGCYQGQTHGHEGFLLSPDEALEIIQADPVCQEILFPYLIGNELVGLADPKPQRYVIDFHPRDVLAARAYKAPFERVQNLVLPDRKKKAAEEEARNTEVLTGSPDAKVNLHHANFLARWWLLSYPREELLSKLAPLTRYVACVRVTRRPIFEFVSTAIHPSDALVAFPFEDDYSFGILQSVAHWDWFNARCSTFKGDPRYTSLTVFDSFPWPQAPSLRDVQAIANAAVALRKVRRSLTTKYGLSLRGMYRTLDAPGKNPLRDAQAALDREVRAAYGMGKKDDILTFLLNLNLSVAKLEKAGVEVIGPGLPPSVPRLKSLVTSDCIAPALFPHSL